MKRPLFETVKVSPYTLGDTVDRYGFLSAVLGLAAEADGELAVTVNHSDTIDGTFEPVVDNRLIAYGPDEEPAEGDHVMLGIDLIGCKQFIQITVDGITEPCALVLGDPAAAPVEA